MPESTLNLDYASLRSAIGHFIGAGRTSSSWTTGQSNNINAALASGLRSFYWPDNSYDWSFLHPWSSLTTAIGVNAYPLPDDFGSMESDLTWKSETGGAFTVKQIDSHKIRELRQGVDVSNGKPEFFAVEISDRPSGASSNRWQIVFERGFDDEYELEYRYRVLPNTLASGEYPYGSAQHADTILAAVLAAAEDQVMHTRGVHWQRWQERLAASITHDSRNTASRVGPYGQHGAEPVGNLQPAIRLLYNGVDVDTL